MKIVSIILRVVAVLAAAACIYAWVDTKGKISSAESQMANISGATLADKAVEASTIAKKYKDLNEKQIPALQKSLKAAEAEKTALDSELESERAKNVRAQSDISSKNDEIRSLNANISSLKKQISQKDTLVDALKREIVSTKALITQGSDSSSTKEKVASLESELDQKTKALDEANAKIKLFENGTVVYVVENGANGSKVIKKKVKIPYLAKNDVATVIKFDKANGLFAINRGSNAQVKASQVIDLKREGVLVARVDVVDAAEDFAVVAFEKNMGIPETIEVGDKLEMFPVEVAAPADNKAEAEKAAAPAAEAEEAVEDSPADEDSSAEESSEE